MLNSSLEFTEGSSSKEKLTVTRALAVATRWLPARAGFNYVFMTTRTGAVKGEPEGAQLAGHFAILEPGEATH